MIIRVVFREPAASTIIPGPGPWVRNLPGNQRELIFPCHSIVCSPGTCRTGVSGKYAAQKTGQGIFPRLASFIFSDPEKIPGGDFSFFSNLFFQGKGSFLDLQRKPLWEKGDKPSPLHNPDPGYTHPGPI